VDETRSHRWVESKRRSRVGSVTLTLGSDNLTPQGSVRKTPQVVSGWHPQKTLIRNNKERNHQSEIGTYTYLVENSENKKMIDDFFERCSVEEFDRIGVLINEYLNKNDDKSTPVKNIAGYIRATFEQQLA